MNNKKYTEKDVENDIRTLIKDEIIVHFPEIQILESKDVTDIICCNNRAPTLHFIEVKHFSSKNNRIGFGSKGKVTFQPEILKTKPVYFEWYTRWIFCDENGEDYYILTNKDCRKYIMGDEISYDKQNNFKLTIFENERKYSKNELVDYLVDWFGCI